MLTRHVDATGSIDSVHDRGRSIDPPSGWPRGLLHVDDEQLVLPARQIASA